MFSNASRDKRFLVITQRKIEATKILNVSKMKSDDNSFTGLKNHLFFVSANATADKEDMKLHCLINCGAVKRIHKWHFHTIRENRNCWAVIYFFSNITASHFSIYFTFIFNELDETYFFHRVVRDYAFVSTKGFFFFTSRTGSNPPDATKKPAWRSLHFIWRRRAFFLLTVRIVLPFPPEFPGGRSEHVEVRRH